MTHFFCFARRSTPQTHLPPSPRAPMRSTWCGHWKDAMKKSPVVDQNVSYEEREKYIEVNRHTDGVGISTSGVTRDKLRVHVSRTVTLICTTGGIQARASGDHSRGPEVSHPLFSGHRNKSLCVGGTPARELTRKKKKTHDWIPSFVGPYFLMSP